MSSLRKAIKKIIHTIKETENPEVAEAAPSASMSLPPKVYLKALPLRTLEDVDMIKREVKSGNILILKISPLAKKSVEDVKRAVSELFEFTQSIEGDIARLGEERIVICPSTVKIWRGKTPASKPEVEPPTAT